MPENQGPLVILQRAGRCDPCRRHRGAAAGDAVVAGLEGESRDRARRARPGHPALALRLSRRAFRHRPKGEARSSGTLAWNLEPGLAAVQRPGMTSLLTG